MRRLPLRRRLVLAAVLSFALALALLLPAFNLVLATRLTSDADTLLRSRADAQLATLSTEDGPLAVEERLGRTLLDRNAWVFDTRRRVIARASGPPAVQRGVARLAGVDRPTTREPDADTRVLAVPAFGAGGRRRLGTVAVSVSRIPYERGERTALIGSLVLGALLLVFTAIAAHRIVGVALRPVTRMTRQAADWSERDLGRRFGQGPPRDEITGLAATLDGLLERLAASLRHEQRFSAEVAHELRTPLAGTRMAAELALRHDRPPEELRAALEEVLRGTDRMAAVVDTLVHAAQAEAQPGLGTSNAEAAARAALSGVQAPADEQGIELVLEPPPSPATVGVEREVVERILSPVLDNGLRYGGARVRVRIEADERWVTFVVTDDGPGIAPQEAERVFEPGQRGSAAAGARGAGLGLALTRRLARAAGGEAEAARGGTAIRLPAARSGQARQGS